MLLFSVRNANSMGKIFILCESYTCIVVEISDTDYNFIGLVVFDRLSEWNVSSVEGRLQRSLTAISHMSAVARRSLYTDRTQTSTTS